MKPRLLAGSLGLVLCAGLSGCSEETVAPLPEREARVELDGYALSYDPALASLVLWRQGQELTRLPLAEIAVLSVETVEPLRSYDPWILYADPLSPIAPPGLSEHAPVSIELLESSPRAFALALRHQGGVSSRLDVAVLQQGTFRCQLSVTQAGDRVVEQGLSLEVAATEAFYGLGESFDDVNQRGHLRAMQLEPAVLESGYNEAHVPVPLLIADTGWGLFVESQRAGVFDVAKSEPDRVRLLFAAGAPAAEPLVFHLLAAEHPLDVTYRYYSLTGFPKLPAPWAYGPLVWRDENEDQAQVESDLRTMRDLDLAASGIWIDRPYATGVNTFDFNADQFPDPDAMIGLAHDLGFRVALWHTPYLDESDPATLALREAAKAAGAYPWQTGLNLNGWGKPLDLSTPSSRSFWQDQIRRYTERGIEGFKLDYGEDVVPDLVGARNLFSFRNGEDERTMHHGYTLAYHQTYAELMPEDGGFLLCRAGRWGDQKHGCVIWPGDLDATFWKHGELVMQDGETFRAVGGLPASLVAGLSLGPSGFPFYGADTGGYRHSPPDPEVFRRWFEQTALSPVMQIGTSTNDVAWEFGDPELLASYREFTRLHLRLFPYVWSLAHELPKTGRAIMRPFGLAEPEHGQHPNDQYFLGDDLLVAPVLAAGVSQREVFFGSGDWASFFDGSLVSGPGTGTVAAPLGTLPLFQRAGSLIPLLRPSIDTLAPVSDTQAVDSFASDPGKLYWQVAPGMAGERTLYDGSHASQLAGSDGIRFVVRSGNVYTKGAVLELYGFGPLPPARVEVDSSAAPRIFDESTLSSEPIAWLFDPTRRGGTLLVAVAAGQRQVLVSTAAR